jgi:four helix bundle protein
LKQRIERFEDLIAWQKARSLVREIYRISRKQQFSRDFALRDQIRKAAISIPSNISEGFERYRRTEFHQFLSIAKASCAEVRTQLYLAFDVGYIDAETLATVLKNAEEVSRIIGGLRNTVASKPTQHSAPSTQN